MATETLNFLEALYANAEGWVTVSGINGTGIWKDGIKSARIGADLTRVLCDGEQQRWFRIQPQASQHDRGEVNTASVVALIADFDFAGSSDSKKLAPFDDLDDVARFLKVHVPVKVSAVVSSGHGAHAYWFLDEPLDPVEGKELLVRFDLYLRERAKGEGKQLDPMQDLARVLRMPGSINAKHPDALVPVSVESLYPERRSSLDDFDWLPEPPQPAEAPTEAPELDVEIPEWLERKISTEDGNGDRSQAQVYLVHACLRAGLTIEQTWAAVQLNPATVSKWGGRSDWRRHFDKIVADHDWTEQSDRHADQDSTPIEFQAGGVVFDQPAIPDSIWGNDEQSLWAKGEGLMLYAATGIGKTTVAQKVVLAGVGIGKPQVLGFTVHPFTGNVLYIAADRPRQAMRSLRRMVTSGDRHILDSRFLWETKRQLRISPDDPEALLRLAAKAGCEGGAAVIDSIKDVVPKISTDESGGAFNDAMQLCIVNGIDVLSLHHPRKGTQENKRTRLSLDDVYGSTWVTAGQGSVIALNGQAGAGTAAFSHLKQPADEISGFDVSFDYDLGTITTIGNRDIREYLYSLQGRGVSTAQVVGFVTGGTNYTDAERKRVMRRLNRLAEYGDIIRSGDAVPLWSVPYAEFVGQADVSPDTPRTPRTDTPPDTTGHERPVPW